MNLNPLSADYAKTRDALHQIAFFAVSPVRYKSVGRMGLKATRGGFGTPEFQGRIARVEGTLLVYEDSGNVASQTISTIRDAAGFFGIDYEVDWFADFHDPLEPVDPDQPLEVDDLAARELGNWFDFATDVLNRVRERGTDDEVSEVQLWPEHFDPATELGSQANGERASYGASPGDGANPEPYMYVAAWGEIERSNSYWNAQSFNGSSIGYSALRSADDPIETAVDFLLEGYRILHSG